MSKLTIERKIYSIVEQMDGWSYIYDDYRTINQRLDQTPLPCVVFAVPASGTLFVGATEYRDSVQASIAFAMACDIDPDGVLLDAEVIEECKRAALAFIALCNGSGLFEYIEDQPYQVFVKSYDANVAGVLITPTITEVQGVSVCTSAEELLNG